MFNNNKPDTWGCAEVYQPPPFPVSAFQKKLDAIFPPTIKGQPRVRLVWAGDIQRCYSKFGAEWSKITGHATKWDLRAKYRYAELKIDGEFLDVPPPRWILEQREEPGQYLQSWEAGRWNKDGQEVRPPAPLDGYYSHLWTIARHSETCCKDTPKGLVCWGKYREPDDRDIEVLKRAKYYRDKDEAFSLENPVPDKILASAAKTANEKALRKQTEADEELKEYIDDNALELIEMFTGIKCSEKTKKFSIPKGSLMTI